MFIPIVFAVLLTLAAADEEDLTYPGKCPEFSPVENFDIDKYVEGTWYSTYYHGKGKWFQQRHCPEIRLSYNAEKKELFFEKYYLNASLPMWRNATTDHLVSHPGSFQYPESVRSERTEWWYHVISKVVFTDYVNYGVYWGCYDIEGKDKHYEFISINSRQRHLPAQYLDQIKAFFTERYPSVDIKAVPWADCRAKCPEAA